MDAAAEETRNCKRARLTTPSAGGDGDDVDRISGLNDDVLLHILGLVGDARDVVRTGALSRRWLGLSTRVPALRFTSRPLPWSVAERCAGHNCSFDDVLAVYRAALERYVSSVNDVLALRTTQSDCAVERLAISYAYMPSASTDLSACWNPHILEALMPPSVGAMQGWIRYALQHGVKSFSLDMRLPNLWNVHDRYDSGENKSLMFLDALPGSGSRPERLEAMWLSLGGATLRLPAAMKFASLVDLSLEWIKMEASSVHLLARLVSSASCPRLRKLRMRKLCVAAFRQEIQLELEADMLSELRIEEINFLTSLKLRTPSLKVLYYSSYCALTVSAPMLEELEMYFGGCLFPLHVDGDFPCVRSLKMCLTTFRPVSLMHYGEDTDTNIQLLRHCTSLTCLDVTLSIPNINEWDVDIIKNGISLFPNITYLTVNISRWFGRHAYGASVASLLTRFSNLRRLSLHLHFNGADTIYSGSDHSCVHQQYHWKYNKFSMAHLHEVELTGLTGTDCEFWFVKTVLARARRLHKVAIKFYPKCCQHEVRMESFERILLNEGTWTFHRDAFTLTCVKLV